MGDLSQNFSRSEFACKCGECDFDTVDYELVMVLESVRSFFGKILINSGCRCPAHNEAVGGSDKSQHLLGRAADIRSETHDSAEIHAFLYNSHADSLGIGLYDSFVHVDTRNYKARW